MADWDMPANDGGSWDMPVASDGWGTASAVETGWGEADPQLVLAAAAAKAAAPPRPARPPPRREDDEKAAKFVNTTCDKVLAGKKKLAGFRSKMDDLDAKRLSLQTQIDDILPALQDARAQKSLALGQIQETRLPQIWVERARELNTRRKSLPGGCTSTAELMRAVKSLEYSIEHGSLSLKQEKAALEQIRELKKGKAVISAYEADQATLDRVREEHKTIQQEAKPVQQNLDELKATTSEKAAI